ncbi:hypothetical protein BDZ89DRAFT_1144318 [Hymenopellis radicata]|nr:hypothetical protein BDZ89DRAFT_1144318 [Hymenopellis radicata]
MGKTRTHKQQRDPEEPVIPTKRYPNVHDFTAALVTQYIATCDLASVLTRTQYDNILRSVREGNRTVAASTPFMHPFLTRKATTVKKGQLFAHDRWVVCLDDFVTTLLSIPIDVSLRDMRRIAEESFVGLPFALVEQWHTGLQQLPFARFLEESRTTERDAENAVAGEAESQSAIDVDASQAASAFEATSTTHVSSSPEATTGHGSSPPQSKKRLRDDLTVPDYPTDATEVPSAVDDPKETVSQSLSRPLSPASSPLAAVDLELYEKIDQETVALREQLSETAADWMSFKGGIFLGTADAAATQARYEHTRNLAFEAFPMSIEEAQLLAHICMEEPLDDPLDAARTYGHLWSEDLGGHGHYVKDWLAELDDALGPLLRETEVAFGV